MVTNFLQEKILKYRLQDKDKDAFIKCYDLYLNELYRFIFFKTNKKEDAEDLTSLVFLKAWDYILNNGVKDVTTIKALLYRIARNAVIDFYRKKSSSEVSLDDVIRNDASFEVDEQFDVDDIVDGKIDKERLMENLAELKAEYREVLVLRYVNELSISEIADVLEKNKTNVRVLIHRALSALRVMYDKDLATNSIRE